MNKQESGREEELSPTQGGSYSKRGPSDFILRAACDQMRGPHSVAHFERALASDEGRWARRKQEGWDGRRLIQRWGPLFLGCS